MNPASLWKENAVNHYPSKRERHTYRREARRISGVQGTNAKKRIEVRESDADAGRVLAAALRIKELSFECRICLRVLAREEVVLDEKGKPIRGDVDPEVAVVGGVSVHTPTSTFFYVSGHLRERL